MKNRISLQSHGGQITIGINGRYYDVESISEALKIAGQLQGVSYSKSKRKA